MDDTELLRRRLRHQRITTPGFASPAATVAAFGAMQAQDFAMACWAVGLRTRNATEASVLAAFDAGEILRTHVLRPTWHFVAPADLRWLMTLSAPRVLALNAYQHRQLGLETPTLRRAADAIVRALADGRPRTREELQRALQERRIRVSGPALAYAVMYAELHALVCSGPRLGKRFSYVLVDQRVPSQPAVTPDEALRKLAERFFATRGPATPEDFAAWCSFSLRAVLAAIEGLASDFARERQGRTQLIFPRRLPAARRNAPAAALLPEYDEYGMGYRDRRAFLGNLGPAASAFNRLVLLRGRVVGTWRRTLAGKQVRLEQQLPEDLSAADRAEIAAATSRYCEFLGRAGAH